MTYYQQLSIAQADSETYRALLEKTNNKLHQATCFVALMFLIHHHENIINDVNNI